MAPVISKSLTKTRALCDWINSHLGEPRNSKEGLPEEAKLAAWLSYRRSFVKAGHTLPPQEALILNQSGLEDLYKMSSYRVRDKDFERVLWKWVEMEGKEPEESSDSPLERKLAKWLRFKRAMGFTPIQADTTIPNMFFDNRGSYHETQYCALLKWVLGAGRLPRRKSSDPEERSLALWSYRVREGVTKASESIRKEVIDLAP